MDTSLTHDCPITTSDEDLLRRDTFAKRLADTIRDWEDDQNLVLGIYGAWGAGKSSVLNLMSNHLNHGADHYVRVVQFNPWYFADQAELIGQFFSRIMAELGKEESSQFDNLRESLKKYGSVAAKVASAVSVGIGPLSLNAGDIVSGIGSADTDLIVLKQKVASELKKAKLRIIVLIDDVDRLDQDDMYAVFKLVKLVADFPFTTYVLAFDQAVVSKVLSGRYGGTNNAETGASFIEKIVQFGVDLPPVDPDTLRTLVLEGAVGSTIAAGVKPSTEEIDRLVRVWDGSLGRNLGTIRTAKRYLNAITFSVPLVAGEVNVVDLLLLEGLRIMYPKVYYTLRQNKELCIGKVGNFRITDDTIKSAHREVLERSLEGLGSREVEALLNLLWELFPAIESLWPNRFGLGHSEELAALQQRICSTNYFDRYFFYQVLPRDVSDNELISFLSQINGNECIADVVQDLRNLAGEHGMQALVSKLFTKRERITVPQAQILAVALSQMAGSFSRRDSVFSFLSTYDRAAELVTALVLSVPHDQRVETMDRITVIADPVDFSLVVARKMIRPGHDTSITSAQGFGEAESLHIYRSIARRIEEAYERIEDLVLQSPYMVRPMIQCWARYGIAERLRADLRRWFAQDSVNAQVFVGSFTPKARDLQTGVISVDNFGRDDYDMISQIFPVEELARYLVDSLGSDVDYSRYKESDREGEEDWQQRASQQFLYIHNVVMAQAKKSEVDSKS